MIRDLADIAELRRNDTFGRYFIRRLTGIRDQLQKSFEEDEMDAVKRESTRQQLKQLKEILSMMDRDETIIQNQLNKINLMPPRQVG